MTLLTTCGSPAATPRAGHVRRSTVAVMLAMALLLALAVGDVAAVTGWTGPTRVFDGPYREVSMDVDTNGKVHAAARGSTGLWYLTNRSGSWTRSRLTTNPLDGRDVHPTLSIDLDGSVHVAFARYTCLDCAPREDAELLYLTNRGRAGGSFPEDPTFLAIGEEPSLQVVDGKVYVAHSTCWCRPEQSSAPLGFTTNASGTWTTTTVFDGGKSPSLRVASSGRARIAFIDSGYGDGVGQVVYASAGSSSGAFSISRLDVYYNGRDPSLRLDGLDRPHIAWTVNEAPSSGGGTYYAKRSGGYWVGGRFTTIKWDVELAVDGLNKPHLAVLGPGAGVYYYRLVDGSLTRKTLSSAAVANSVGIEIGPNGRPVEFPIDVKSSR